MVSGITVTAISSLNNAPGFGFNSRISCSAVRIISLLKPVALTKPEILCWANNVKLFCTIDIAAWKTSGLYFFLLNCS